MILNNGHVPEFFVEPTKFLYDGMHVTDEGSAVYAKEIASVLMSEIIK